MKKDTPAVKRAAATGVKMCAVLLIAICLGTVLLYAAYLLPTASMSGHLEESIPVFQAEGSYPRQASWCSSTLDNFTDALMLLTAAYDGGEPTMDKAMNLYFRTVETTPDFNPVNSVLSCGSENMELAMRTYTRYWEGYLIFLKPLLSVMNYQQIRILNQIFQVAVLLLLVFLMERSGNRRFILPLLLSLGSLPLIVNAQSLTYSDVYYLPEGGSCILILNWEKWKNSEKLLFFFFILGILTSYLDFLTYPLVSFGIPACLCFCLKEENNFWRSLKAFACLGLAWGVGYAGMWAGKWVCASIFTSKNAMREGLSAVLFRSGAVLENAVPVSLSDTILRNVGEWVKNPCFILFWLFCIVMLALILKKDCFEFMAKHLIFLIIAFMPFAWYIAVRNHSYVHYFFTYKELVVFAFAVMCFFVKSLPTGLKRGGEARRG